MDERAVRSFGEAGGDEAGMDVEQVWVRRSVRAAVNLWEVRRSIERCDHSQRYLGVVRATLT